MRAVRKSTVPPLSTYWKTAIEPDTSQVCRGGGKVAKKMRFNVKTDENARQLGQCFEKEWEIYESKRGDTQIVDTKTLYRAPKKNAAGNAKESETASEAEESEFNG